MQIRVFSIALFVLSLLTGHASAHDPGLSSAKVTLNDKEIQVLLGFAPKDVQGLLFAESGQQLAIHSPEEFRSVQTKLQAIGASRFRLYAGEQRIIPARADVVRKDDQNIEIMLYFERPVTPHIRLVSTMFERLPLGHREYLSVVTPANGSLGEAMLSASENFLEIDLPALSPAEGNPPPSFVAFLRLGIEHILTGYDHLLFLFALMVVCRDLRSILTVITCFTVAHSITLALAALDIVRLPGRVVEPMIAASIAYVGIENLIRGSAPKWRGLITFSFGLVHGLGFADALREAGIGSAGWGMVFPLVGFNLGVELGQLSVAAVVLPILWQLQKNPSFIRQWVPAGSALVAILGGYWMVERIFKN
jgi:hydrogenase/urease accessory protein HupE